MTVISKFYKELVDTQLTEFDNFIIFFFIKLSNLNNHSQSSEKRFNLLKINYEN